MIIVDTLACKRYHDFDSALMKLRVRFANAADESGRNANLFTQVCFEAPRWLVHYSRFSTTKRMFLHSSVLEDCTQQRRFLMKVEGSSFGVNAIRAVGGAELWARRCLSQYRSGFCFSARYEFCACFFCVCDISSQFFRCPWGRRLLCSSGCMLTASQEQLPGQRQKNCKFLIEFLLQKQNG